MAKQMQQRISRKIRKQLRKQHGRRSWKTYLASMYAGSPTPQSQPLPNTTQVPNSAGGFAWQIDQWSRLDRFLILGTEGGTYYIKQRALTVKNVDALRSCVAEDGLRTVARIVEISQSGRAPKNDPALFALAFCAGSADAETRRAALDALPQVARIGTHLFHFLAYAEELRGWGRAMRRAVGNWYNSMPAERLTYQAVKYQQRDGWSHRDALRLAHPKAADEQHNAIYHWITQGWPSVGDDVHPDQAMRMLWAFERAKLADTETEIAALIGEHGLPWEAIPSQWHGSAAVWKALLPQLPMTALLRNLARLTANNVLVPNGAETDLVVKRLTDVDRLRRARIHPIAVLSALTVYQSGRGARGNLTWAPITAVVDALDGAFYAAFGNVTATGKQMVLALDVSSSMEWGTIAGVPGLTPRVGSAAMALVTAAVEHSITTVAFGHEMVRINVSPRQRLDDVVKTVSKLPFGGTDCALPMLWALKNKVQADAFVIYTDSETWFGNVHPAEALRRYRKKMGIPAKLIVVGMTAKPVQHRRPERRRHVGCRRFRYGPHRS